MRSTLFTLKKWTGYAIYTVLLTTGLLVYRFPSDKIEGYLVSEAAGADPPMVLSLKEVFLGWPPGIHLMDTGISLRETPQKELLRAKRMVIAPSAWSFLSGAPRYHFDAHAYSGDIEGHIGFDRYTADGPFETSFRFRDIHIHEHTYLASLGNQNVSGVLGGAIQYSGERNRVIDGVGQGTIVLSGGRIRLSQPILGIDSVDFDRLSMEIALKGRRITFNRVQLDGATVKGELSGAITLNTDLPKSRLDLKGTLEPLGGLFGNSGGHAGALALLSQGLKKLKRSFVIQGTFGNPVFRFL